MYVDANHGGCKRTGRSTTGVHVEYSTPNATMKIAHKGNVQKVTAYSTTDAEYTALATSIMDVDMHVQESYKVMHEEPTFLNILADNTATGAIAASGDTRKLRYINKHQRVRQGFVRDALLKRHNDRQVERVDTAHNKAAWLTKGLEKIKHAEALSLNNMSQERYRKMMSDTSAQPAVARTRGSANNTASSAPRRGAAHVVIYK